MNNLKRVLALLLSVVMLVGVMAIGASALTVEDFSDSDTIAADKSEAVQGTVALSIINGLPDGSFDPTGIVTREQAAKMIYVALNGGRDNSKLAADPKNPKFDDVTNWAQGYVEWCAVKGIIAGQGDGTFDPEGKLTPTMLAKLLLVAIGYDAKIEGLEGTVDWAINTNSLANNSGFYEGIEDIDPTAEMSREDAAQMIWNAVRAEMVEYPGNLTVDANGNLTASDKVKYSKDINGTASVTILGDVYNLDEKEAWVKTTSYSDGKYSTTLTTTNTDFASTAIASGNQFIGTFGATADDYSNLFGQKVTVLVNSKNVATGIIANGEAVLVEGVVGKLPDLAADAESFKYDGTTYNLDAAANATPVYVFNNSTSVGNLNAYKTAKTNTHYAFQLIDNNGDGKGNIVVVYPVTVDVVDTLTSTTIKTSGKAIRNRSAVELYNGIAEGDVVTISTPITGKKDVYEKLDVAFTGKVTATRTGEIQVDGTWYTVEDSYTIGHEYDFYTVNGWIVKATDKDAAPASTEVKYAVLLGAQEANTFTGTPAQIKLLLDDNSETVLTAGDNITTSPLKVGSLTVANHDLVTYKATSGKYALTVAADNNGNGKSESKAETDTGFAAVLAEDTAFQIANEPANGKLCQVDIADDAVIFTENDAGDEWHVITGAALKKYAAGSVASVKNAYTKKNANGFTQVALAYVKLAANTKIATRNYGYVTSGQTETADGIVLSFFNVDGDQKDIVATKPVADGVAAGSVIKYTVADDGKYAIEQSDASLGRITAWDGKKIEITDADGSTKTTSNVDAETVLFFIDSANKAGTEGKVALAADEEKDADQKVVITGYNVYYVATDNGHADVLIVDVNSNLSKAAGSTKSLTADSNVTAAQVKTALASNDNVAVDTTKLQASTTAVTVNKGNTLTLSGTDTATAKEVTVTLADGGKVVVTATSNITDSNRDFTLTGEGTAEIKADVTSEAMSQSADKDIATRLGGASDTTAKTAGKSNVDATLKTVPLTINRAGVALTGTGKLTTLGFDSFDAIAKKNGSTSVSAYYFEIDGLTNNDVLTAVKVLKDGTKVNCDGVLDPAGSGHDIKTNTSEDFIMLLGDQVESVVFTVKVGGVATDTYTITLTLTDPA